MGDYRIVVEATGGHGCQRELGDGASVPGCGQKGCPDCIAREFVARLKASGQTMRSATLTHWPGEPSEVSDDLLSGIRKGAFPAPRF